MNDTNREAEIREWVEQAEERVEYSVTLFGDHRIARHGRFLLSALEREREARQEVEGWLTTLVNTSAAPVEIGGWRELFVRAHGHASRYLHERGHGADAPTAVARALLTTEDSNKTTAVHTERSE